MTTNGLTPQQKQEYTERGYTVLPGFLSSDECQAVIDHMMDLKMGRKTLEGFSTDGTDDIENPQTWSRTHNQHLYDPVAMDLMLHPQLRKPLVDCFGGEPEGVQTMYFWSGSEQHWHQDQYYLPGCMSAWMALVDVNQDNGTIWVQPGSHRRHLLTFADMQERYGDIAFETFDGRYDTEIDKQVEENREALGVGEEPVEVSAGAVVLFHGVLIHRGGPIGKPGSYRHVMASHYIRGDFDGWPWQQWARIDFDGNRRCGA